MIKLHHLRPAPGAKTKKTRVGRGIAAGKGKTAGRGTKGTKARRQVRVGFEGGQMPLHMRLPKKRGFKNPFHIEYQVINVAKLQELYPSGGDVKIDDLVQNGIVRDQSLIKILGTGEITVALNIEADAVSKGALEKIEKAGGKVTIVDLEADDLDDEAGEE